MKCEFSNMCEANLKGRFLFLFLFYITEFFLVEVGGGGYIPYHSANISKNVH